MIIVRELGRRGYILTFRKNHLLFSKEIFAFDYQSYQDITIFWPEFTHNLTDEQLMLIFTLRFYNCERNYFSHSAVN